MKEKACKLRKEVLEYQPDAVEIEETPIPGKARWVLYVILVSLVAVVVGAILFHVDRIVVAEGELITTSPTIVVQPLQTAMIRSIEVQVGEVVEKGQVLATLDATFASADLSQLTRQQLTLGSQLRRIQAELGGKGFTALPEEGEDGKLQAQLFHQRKTILEKNRRMSEEKIEALKSKLALIAVRRDGAVKQLRLLRDVEGETAKLPQTGTDYRLRLLEAQRNRSQTRSEIESYEAEEQVTVNELKQARAEWQRFVEERTGELMEEEVALRRELEKLMEEIHKAKRLHELVSLKAPEDGIVLNMAERSVGSIMQQAEQFITLVPLNSTIEVEANVQSKDIARIRVGDAVRVKLDAFPFQRHDTLPGEVRIISEDSYQLDSLAKMAESGASEEQSGAFYRTRIRLKSKKLRDVPQGFRLIPGMKVRSEIKVGKRRVVSYFLYPIIRALDESLREP